MRWIMCRISPKLIFVIIISIIYCNTCLAFDFSDAPINSSKWTKKYDSYFNKFGKRYFGPGFEDKWIKAQAITESALKEDAESWVGAKGIMQVMPSTFNDIKKRNKYIVGELNQPRWNIEAGVYYDKYLFDNWTAKRPYLDRLAFTFASYNAGMGNVLKGQVECNKVLQEDINCNLWVSIIPVAHKVKSWRAEETLNYVERIFKLMGK